MYVLVCGCVFMYLRILNWGTVYVLDNLEVIYKLFLYTRDLYSAYYTHTRELKCSLLLGGVA